MKISVKDGVLIVGAWAISLALLLNLCDLIFRCGCTFAWAGAASHCNVHNPAPPHCPWCCHGLAGSLWVRAIILPAEAAAILGLRKRGTLAQIAGAAVTYIVVGAAIGLFFALLDGYPHWLGIPLR